MENTNFLSYLFYSEFDLSEGSSLRACYPLPLPAPPKFAIYTAKTFVLFILFNYSLPSIVLLLSICFQNKFCFCKNISFYICFIFLSLRRACIFFIDSLLNSYLPYTTHSRSFQRF